MPLEFQVGSWSSPPTIVATRFWERWRGLRPRSACRALLLKGSSVHGFGMKESLWAIGLDHADVVMAISFLPPGRYTRVPGAIWILEMSATCMPPPIGSTLVAGSW